MRHIRRSRYLCFFLEDEAVFDVGAFLRGALEISTGSGINAASTLTGSTHPISFEELRFLASLPERSWTPMPQTPAGLDDDQLKGLLAKGLLLSDGDETEAVRMRRRDERLATLQWHPVAAFYHFVGRGLEAVGSETDVEDLQANAARDADSFLDRCGPPPEAFHRHTHENVELPLIEKNGGLYDALRARKTIRAFDSTRSLKLEDLSTLLRYVFGCHGYTRLSEVLLLHKTSPSGGSLHPIEAYPLILDVQGLDPGLYHYDLRAHSLRVIQRLEREEARTLAAEFANGQQYASSAHALVLMTARFFRNQWKYRRRSRTYSVMLMDTGHLSQTFYLVAAELGLGAFFSAAINGRAIEARLGLEPTEEGALGICGCGVRTRRVSELGLEFQPFTPGKTKI